MANFFSLNDGLLSSSATYGSSIAGSEVTSNTTGVWLGTTDAYCPVFKGDGSSIVSVVFQLSAKKGSANSSNLFLKLSSGSVIITETYPISSLTDFDDSTNLQFGFPTSYQSLKLTTPYTLLGTSSARVSFTTSTANVLSIMGATALNNYNKFVLKSSVVDPTSADVIHIGGSLVGSSVETRTVTATTGSYNSLYIHNDGVLTFPPDVSVSLSATGANGIQITPDGTLNVGTSSSIIPLATTHTITLSNTHLDVHNGGNLTVYGYPRLYTTNLISDTLSGSRTFAATDAISGIWNVGDTLVFKPNFVQKTVFDTLILSSFPSVNSFTTTTSSVFTHTGSATFTNVPAVYNLNRNINIKGLNTISRGSIRSIDAAKVNINDCYFSNFGFDAASRRGLMLFSNKSGYNTLSGNVIDIGGTFSIGGLYIANPAYRTYTHNLTFNNNIIWKGNTTQSVFLQNLSADNLNINNNYFLSGGNFDSMMNVFGVSGTASMSNNFAIGSKLNGSLLLNNKIVGTYGVIGYNSTLKGMIVQGTNTGTVVGGGINSGQEGVNIDGTSSTLSGLTFSNIIASNNTTVGVLVSGNSTNLLTPIKLNVNGLTANDNAGVGFEGYSITGNLSSMTLNGNNGYGIKTSIGNASTIFDGISSAGTLLTGNTLTKVGTTLSAASPFGVGTDSSIKFNGTSDYLNVGNFSQFPLTGDFTIEFWLNFPSNSATSSALFDTWENTSVSVGNSQVSINPSGKLLLYYDGNSVMTGNTTITTNTWHHVAVVRSNNSIRFYIDGVLDTTTPVSFSGYVFKNSYQFNIGRQSNGATLFYNGCLSNIRIVKGTALYTSNFNTSAPISPITPLSIVPNTVFLYNDPYSTLYKTSSSFACAFGILSAQNYFPTVIKNSKLITNTLSSNNGSAISLDSSKFESFTVDSSTLSSYQDIQTNTTRNLLQGSYQFNNCTFGSGILSTVTDDYQPEVFTENGFVVMKENGVANKHYKLLRAGKISLDSTFAYGSNTVSEKLEPTSSTIQLRCGSKMIPVNKDTSYTVSCYIYKSSGYTGAAPRLMLKRNIPLGYQDTVLATSVLANGSWEQLTGVVPAALDQGIFEVYVDCSGNAGSGSVNIDNWSLTLV